MEYSQLVRNNMEMWLHQSPICLTRTVLRNICSIHYGKSYGALYCNKLSINFSLTLCFRESKKKCNPLDTANMTARKTHAIHFT